jgi:stage III sporulation protein SpoIIIAA
VEVVLDLGRPPEARFPRGGAFLAEEPIGRDDLAFVTERVGRFGGDNRAGIERTLHRISALRNRQGETVGLTCRVGRAVFGTVDILRDVVEEGSSLLLLGRPGVGKTTLLREAARVLADDLAKRVIVVDTSNEIAGDGDVPHPGIGRARRMQVPTPAAQADVMIEAVENHMPEVIVIDEIGTRDEAAAARTIAERGVQLIATAHGNTLDNLLQNPTLSDLVGGVQVVTLGDEEARRRGTRKTVLERKAPPTFDVLVEIESQDALAVHHDVAEVVDSLLRGKAQRPERRRRKKDGEVEIRPAAAATGPALPARAGAEVGRRRRRQRGERRPWEGADGGPGAGGEAGADAGVAPGRASRILRVFPYAVSRDRLERGVRKLGVPAYVVEDLRQADVILTTKSQERRQPRRLRDAQARGVPLYVVKNNTVTQMESFLRDAFQLSHRRGDETAALEEAEAGVEEVMENRQPVELPPRGPYLRRLQHLLAERHHLSSESHGEEPQRRVVIYPP